jgi:hypothetical protein
MHARRRAALVLALLLGLPGTALADTWGKIPLFPLTSDTWSRNTRGPSRAAHVAPIENGRSVRWRVVFRNRANGEFSAAEGVLALESPRGCDRPELYVPSFGLGRTGTIRLRDSHHEHVVPGHDEAEPAVVAFREFVKDPVEVPVRWQCDAIRDFCAGADVTVSAPEERLLPSSYDESGPSVTMDCGAIDRSIAVCREREAHAAARTRAIADAAARQPICKAVVVPALAEDGDGVELLAVGADGADWGRVTVEPDGLPFRPIAVLLTPLTLPVDILLLVPRAVLAVILVIAAA